MMPLRAFLTRDPDGRSDPDGPDARNKPSVISSKTISSSDHALKQTGTSVCIYIRMCTYVC